MNNDSDRIFMHRNHQMNIPSVSQFKDAPPISMQSPPIPVRNPTSYSSMYNNIPSTYMANRGFNSMLPYNSFNPYNQYSNDWRNILSGYGVSQQFQYIENLVNIFSSISVMMDSTLHAIQSAFYSILTVGDHLKRMQFQFSHIWSTLSLVQLIKSSFKSLLEILRIRSPTKMNNIWMKSVSEEDDLTKSTAKSSYLPVYAYLIIIYIGSHLLMKAYKLLMGNDRHNSWDTDNSQVMSAKALFNYKAERSDELSIKTNQMLKIAPKELQHDSNWCLVSDGCQRGLVPVNYIHINAKISNYADSKLNSF